MALTLEQARKMTCRMHKVLAGRRAGIQEHEDYFKGRHPLKYASPEWQRFHGPRFEGFSDNWCGVVASSPAERQGIVGFRIGDDLDTLSADEQELWQDWQLNDMDAQQAGGLLTSSWAGRSFVSVWGGPDGEPRVRWEDPREMVVCYDPETRERVASLKSWRDPDERHLEYATLKTPDELWYFERSTGSTSIEVPARAAREWGSNAEWVLRSGVDVNPARNPLGMVPDVEWKVRPDLLGVPTSEISGVKCMQDSINLMWSYLFGAADFASLPARVVMGQDPPQIPKLDTNGQVIGYEPVPMEKVTAGRMLYLSGQKTTIGQWDAAKLDVFLDVVNIGGRHVSAQSRTPIYLIVGELSNINGDTLKAAETPMLQKIGHTNAGYIGSTRDVFRLMAGVRGRSAVAQACRLGRVAFKDAETITAAQRSDAALKDRQVGLSLSTILEKHYGMGQAQIDAELRRLEAEKSDPQLEKVLGQIDAAGQQPPAAPGAA